MQISILFEDDDLLVVEKPAGLVVERADTVKGPTLADILSTDFGITLERGGIVHRLDKDTSGLLVVAKNQTALENLQSQFKQRRVKKEYLTLVHGTIMEKGRVEGGIDRNPGNRKKFTVLADGKEAVTEYQPEGKFQIPNSKFQLIFNDLNKIQMRKLEKTRYNQFTLLNCFPQTGRTHQIRVHLKYINHPIVADQKYGGRKVVRLDNRWCPRMFLHAKKLGFYHPKTGEWMEAEKELPEDLAGALSNLESK